MAVSFVAATDTGTSVSVSTINVPVPAGVQAGDVVVVALGQWESSAATPVITPPAGFTQSYTFSSADGFAKNSIWWKRLTGADTGSYTFGFTIPFYTTGQAAGFSGVVASGDPIGAQATSAVGSFGSVTSLALTVGAGDALFWTLYNDLGGSHTPPTGFTEVADADCATSAYLLSAGGTETAAGGSVSTSSSAGVGMVALAAAGGGGGGASTPGPVVAPRPAPVRSSSW